ncbi:MAG: hypothetical protein Fur0022_39890 [Anaerolineales bacterium]
MAMLVQVFLVGLGEVGMMMPDFLQRQKISTLIFGLWILIGLISMGEVLAFPARVWNAQEILAPPEWVWWLRTQPEGAAIIFPFAEGRSVEAFEPTAVGMVWGLVHGKPLVNGYSGFFPQVDREWRGMVAGW